MIIVLNCEFVLLDVGRLVLTVSVQSGCLRLQKRYGDLVLEVNLCSLGASVLLDDRSYKLVLRLILCLLLVEASVVEVVIEIVPARPRRVVVSRPRALLDNFAVAFVVMTKANGSKPGWPDCPVISVVLGGARNHRGVFYFFFPEHELGSLADRNTWVLPFDLINIWNRKWWPDIEGLSFVDSDVFCNIHRAAVGLEGRTELAVLLGC